VRDIHILKQNILLFVKDDGTIISEKMNFRIEGKEKLLNDDLRIELFNFLNSVELKNFIKIIKKMKKGVR
jgi:hypothetical protein